jgi:DNA-binding transcriptional LysR family regulator
MELRQLRYFVAVAEELHFARAAERLHLAQQPVSFQIKQLEGELGVRLFDRTTRQVALTEAGRALLEELYLALAHLERGVEEAQRAQRGERGRLVIGYFSTVLYNLLPETVRRFRQRFPAVELVLQELVLPALEQQVASGELDVALLLWDGQEHLSPELASQPLCTEPILVALPKAHPLSTRTSVPLRELASEPWVIYGRRQKPHTYDQIIALCRRAGFSPSIVQEAATEHAVIGLVAAGLGVALVIGSLKDVHTNAVCYRRLIEPEVHIQFVMVWKRDQASPQVQALLEIANEVASERFLVAEDVLLKK